MIPGTADSAAPGQSARPLKPSSGTKTLAAGLPGLAGRSPVPMTPVSKADVAPRVSTRDKLKGFLSTRTSFHKKSAPASSNETPPGAPKSPASSFEAPARSSRTSTLSSNATAVNSAAPSRTSTMSNMSTVVNSTAPSRTPSFYAPDPGGDAALKQSRTGLSSLNPFRASTSAPISSPPFPKKSSAEVAQAKKADRAFNTSVKFTSLLAKGAVRAADRKIEAAAVMTAEMIMKAIEEGPQALNALLSQIEAVPSLPLAPDMLDLTMPGSFPFDMKTPSPATPAAPAEVEAKPGKFQNFSGNAMSQIKDTGVQQLNKLKDIQEILKNLPKDLKAIPQYLSELPKNLGEKAEEMLADAIFNAVSAAGTAAVGYAGAMVTHQLTPASVVLPEGVRPLNAGTFPGTEGEVKAMLQKTPAELKAESKTIAKSDAIRAYKQASAEKTAAKAAKLDVKNGISLQPPQSTTPNVLQQTYQAVSSTAASVRQQLPAFETVTLPEGERPLMPGTLPEYEEDMKALLQEPAAAATKPPVSTLNTKAAERPPAGQPDTAAKPLTLKERLARKVAETTDSVAQRKYVMEHRLEKKLQEKVLAPATQAATDKAVSIATEQVGLVGQGAMQALERKAQAYIDTLDPTEYDISDITVSGAFPSDPIDDEAAAPAPSSPNKLDMNELDKKLDTLAEPEKPRDFVVPGAWQE